MTDDNLNMSGNLPLHDRVAATLAAIPYAQYLGMQVTESLDSNGYIFFLPFDERLVGNVTLPAIHGGVFATFMEAAALAIAYSLSQQGLPPKLVDFSLDYLASAGPYDLHAACEVHRIGKRVAAVGVRCWQRSVDTPIALARAHVYIAPSSSDASIIGYRPPSEA